MLLPVWEEARRIAEEKEAQLKVDQEAEELQKAMEFADQLQKEAEKAERKAQKAATKAEREPEESDQKAKKVRKAEKAKAKAELAMSKLKAERGAVSSLRWHGNRVGMPRIDFLHDKPEGLEGDVESASGCLEGPTFGGSEEGRQGEG